MLLNILNFIRAKFSAFLFILVVFIIFFQNPVLAYSKTSIYNIARTPTYETDSYFVERLIGFFKPYFDYIFDFGTGNNDLEGKVGSNGSDPNIQAESKKQKELTITEQKNLLIDLTLNTISDEDKANLESFLKTNDFLGSKRQLATLLYFYPSGFIVKPDYLNNEEYVLTLLTSFYTFGQQYIDFYDTATYVNSMNDFSFTFPNDWAFKSYAQHQMGVVVPETNLALNKPFLPEDEVFGVFFYKLCDEGFGNGFDSDISYRISRVKQVWGLDQIRGPEIVDFAGRSGVTKIVLTQTDAGGFTREHYFFRQGDVTYEIAFRYSIEGKDKYYDEGIKIADSFKNEGKSCSEVYDPISKEGVEVFFVGDSVYRQSLLNGGLYNFQ